MARVLAFVVLAVQVLAATEWTQLSDIKQINNDNYVKEVVNSKLPYVLTFIDHNAKDSKLVFDQYNDLAKKLTGKFNFGMVERRQSETLCHTFENRYYPSTYLLKDGMSYKYSDSLTGERLERFVSNKDRYTEAGI